MSEKILMVHASTKGINEVAPGMVMLNLQKGSRFEIEIVCNGLRHVPESDRKINGLVPGAFTKLITAILSLFPYRIKKNWFMTSNRDTIRYYVDVMRYMRKLKPRIAIVHVSYTVCWLIKLVSPGIEVVYYHHGGNMHVKLTDKQWERLVWACPRLIISVTQFAIDGCRGKYKKLPERMINIQNGIELDLDKIKIINKLVLWGRSDVFVYCFAGHLTFSKGVDVIIKSFYLVAAKHEQVRLLLIGGADIKMDNKVNDLIDLINSSSEEFKKKILITGQLPNEESIGYVNSADVSILASQVSEGNSIFAIESMHCGLPLITTNITGNPELNDPKNPSCQFIEVNDHQTDQMAAQMELLLINDNLRMEMSGNARKRAKKHFTLQRMVREFDDTMISVFGHKSDKPLLPITRE